MCGVCRCCTVYGSSWLLRVWTLLLFLTFIIKTDFLAATQQHGKSNNNVKSRWAFLFTNRGKVSIILPPESTSPLAHTCMWHCIVFQAARHRWCLRIDVLRFQRWNLRSFWSGVMDSCVSESAQMKGFITKITSAVGSSFVHRDGDVPTCRVWPVHAAAGPWSNLQECSTIPQTYISD